MVETAGPNKTVCSECVIISHRTTSFLKLVPFGSTRSETPDPDSRASSVCVTIMQGISRAFQAFFTAVSRLMCCIFPGILNSPQDKTSKMYLMLV